jgi:tetratricopeptide (TPR) repeat protein
MQILLKNRFKFIFFISFFILIPDTVFILNPIFPQKPGGLNYFFQMGEKAYKKNDYHSAVFYFQKVLQINSEYIPAIDRLAWSNFYNMAYPEAEQLWNRNLQLDVKNISARIGLARIRMKEGKYLAALKILKKAKNIDPLHLDVNYNQAKLYELLGKKKIAYNKYKEILRTHPDHVESLLGLANIQAELSLFSSSLDNIEKALKLKPENYEGYIHKGQYFLKLYNQENDKTQKIDYLQKAKEAFLTAHGFNENDLETNFLLALIYLGEKNYESAYAYIDKAYKTKPDNFKISSLRADILQYHYNNNKTAGIRSKVVESYKDVLKLNPKDDFCRHRYENFLIRNGFREMNPQRIKASRYHYKNAKDLFKQNRYDHAYYQLLQSLAVYPNLISARIELLNTYLVKNNNLEAYIAGLEALRHAFPNNKKYLHALQWALNQQHKALYFKARLFRKHNKFNFPRSSNRVFVFPFEPVKLFPIHPFGGRVISDKLSVILRTHGRLQSYPEKIRKRIFNHFYETSQEQLYKIPDSEAFFKPEKIKILHDIIPSNMLPDYLVFGTYQEGIIDNQIIINYIVYDAKKGVVVDNFTYSSSEDNKLLNVHIRAVNRMFRNIPYHGKIVKKNSSGEIFINLGKIDGTRPGDLFYLYHKQKMIGILEVKNTDCYISQVIIPKLKDIPALTLKQIQLFDIVRPVKKTGS